MAKLPMLMQRRGSTLVPIDAWAEEQLRDIPLGVSLNVTAKEAAGERSKRRSKNQLYWAGLGLASENIEDRRWPTARKLHKLLMEELGYTTKFYRIDGTYKEEVDSVRFDEMPDPEFFDYFDRAQVWFAANFDFDPWKQWMKEHHPENVLGE